MRRILLVFMFLGVIGGLRAQQDPQFTQYMFNQMYFNPAVAGSHDAICAGLIGRQQWVGFDGRPETYAFTVEAPFQDPFLNQQHGVGLTVSSDALGQESTFGLKLNYAYHYTLGTGGTLSAGMGLGMVQKTLGNQWDAIDPANIDPSIPTGGASATSFDMDFGLYYRVPNKLYVGLSTTHITAADLEDLSGGSLDQFYYGVARHYFLTAGYVIEEVISDLDIEPSILVKSDGTITSFDISGLAIYQDQFYGGLSYRLQDAVALMLGYQYQMSGQGAAGGNLRIGYSYDFTTSQLRQYSGGAHELLVKYCFNITPQVKVQKHRTVRFL